MNTPPAPNPVLQMVLDHLAATFGLAPASLDVLELMPRDLPAGTAEFYAEVKGSHGNHHHNCVVMGGGVYASGSQDEFARLVQEQALLSREDLDAASAMRLYALFGLPRQLVCIDADTLARDPGDWRAYPEVTAPALVRCPDGGATLSFHATPLVEVAPSKWTVAIGPDGQVEVDRQRLAPR